MSVRRRSLLVTLTLLLGLAASAKLARAQTVCATPNCVVAGKPAACQNLAVPRTPTVLLTQSGINFVFDPANPKIEPGDCIIWKSVNFTHSSSGSLCATGTLCNAPPVANCQWESGNLSSVSADPTTTCQYNAADFPAGTGNAYYCRFHATPTTGTMRGTMRVTNPIVLTVDKDLGSNSVKLSWTGGGVTGDFSYKVARNTGGDPLMPAATTTTVDPDGGVLGTSFTDSGDLLDPQTRYYLVRNKQTNEP